MGLLLYVYSILALVCVRSCLTAEYGWPPQKEYSFSIQGENLAGLPQLKQQFAGFRYQGELRVQTHSPRILLVKMINMNVTKIHEELPHGWWRGPSTLVKNKTKSFPITTSTIVVKMTKSMSPELVIQAGLDDWQVNFIKGLVSNLLVYVNDNENSPSGRNGNKMFDSQTKDMYSVMEDSVVGRCEVMYEVSKIPRPLGLMRTNAKLCGQQPMWEITKTRNYSNCQPLNEDHFHLPSQDCTPGGNNCGRFWTRSSLSQLIGCGEKNSLMLLSSVSVSVVNSQLHLHNSSQAVVNSNLNLTLLSISELSARFNAPQNKQTLKTLLYTYSPTPKDKDDDSKEENNLSDSQSRERGSKDKKNKNNKKGRSNNSAEDEDDSNNSNGSNQDSNKKSSRRNSNKNRSDEKRNENDSNESNDSNQGENKKQSGKRNSKNSNSHSSRLIRSLRRTSNENDNYNGRYPNSQKNRYNSNNQRSSDDSNRLNSRNNNGGKNWQSSGESDSNSDEMLLEDQWKINNKEQKSVPPHQPFNLFALAHRTSYDLSCLNPELRQMIADIAGDLQDINILPEKNTLEKLSIAVDICRNLPLDQLQSISEEVFEIRGDSTNIKKINERKVFRDVITMCGTHPALQLLKGWVERQQIKGEEAAEMIVSFPTHTFSPTAHLVQDFFEMVQEVSKKENDQLTITGALALSNLVRQACVNPVARRQQFSSIVTPVCDRKMASQITQWLLQQLDSDKDLTRAYIEAIGNVGSSETLKALRDIVVDPKRSAYHRTSAVFAMRYNVLKQGSELSPLLLSMFHNYSLPVSSRIAAVSLLVYSDPGLTMWQRLAISTYYEPSWAVQQFVSSTLRYMASSKDTLYNHMMKSAYMVQPMSRTAKFNPNLPYNMMSSQMSPDLQRLILEQFSWMRFHDYTSFYYRHSSRDSGYPRTNFEASFNMVNPNGFWNALKDLITSDNNRIPRTPAKGIENTLSRIQESLDLHSHEMPQIQAELNVKITNMMQRLVILNKDSLKSLAKDGRKLITEGLAEGKSYNMQKADMSCFHISSTTEMGFPIEFSIHTPWLITSKADINATNEGLTMEASLMYSAQLLSSVSVMSGWDHTSHSAGAFATNYIQLPTVRTTISIDNATDSPSTPTEALKISTSYIDQHRLLYFTMEPFTSQRRLKIHQPVLQSPDTMKISIGETVQKPMSLLNHRLNTVYTSEEKQSFNPISLIKRARTVMGFPMLMPNTEPRSIETVMNPVQPMAMNITMSLASKSMGVLEVQANNETVIGKLFKLYERIVKSDKNSKETPGKSSATNNEGSQESSNEKNKHDKDSREESSTTTEATSKAQLKKESKEEKDNNKNDSEEKKSNKDKNTSNEDKNKDGKKNKGNKNDKNNSSASGEDSQEQKEKKNSNGNKKKQSSSEEGDIMDSSPAFGKGFEVFSTTYESVSGNFNATQVDPFVNAVNGSSHSYLIEQVLDKIISGDAVVLGLNLWSTDPEQALNVSAYAAYAITYSRRANRLGLFLKKDSSEMKMTLAHEDPVDLAIDIKKRVEEDLLHRVSVDYTLKSNGKDIQAFVKAKLGASRDRLEELKNHPDIESCGQQANRDDFDKSITTTCQDLKSRAMEIGFGNFTIYYNNDAKMLERQVKSYADVSRATLPWTEEKPGQGSNTMDLMLNINSRTQSMNAFLTTPNTSLNMYRMPLDKIPMSSFFEWVSQVDPPRVFCGLSNRHLSTFDGAEIQYKMKDGWHLVTSDCSKQFGFSVIAKSSNNNSLVVEVNMDDQFAIRMEEGPKVSVNGKLQPLDSSHALLRLTDRRGKLVGHTVHTPDNAIHIQMPQHHLDLVYSQSSVVIKARNALQGRLCGLCGRFSGSGIESMIKADGSSANSQAEFMSSYVLQGSGSGSRSQRN